MKTLEIQIGMEANFTSIIQRWKRVSDIEDMIKEMNASIKEIVNSKKLPAENIQKMWGGMRRRILRKIGLEEEEIQVKGKENILNKITEEKFSHMKKTMLTKV